MPSVLTPGMAPVRPVQTALPISRFALNLMALIGVFIFGWLLAVVFSKLGEKTLGWAYVAPVIALGIMARHGNENLTVVAFIIYLAGWVHANLILSGIQAGRR